MRETDITKGSDSPLPNAAGVYRHICKQTGKFDYIGQTNNLRTRQQQHAHTGKYDPDSQFIRFSVTKGGVTKSDLCNVEIRHIVKHNQPGNKTRGRKRKSMIRILNRELEIGNDSIFACTHTTQ